MCREWRFTEKEGKIMLADSILSARGELKSFDELAARFAKKELEPRALDLDYYPHTPFNTAAIDAASEIGLFNLTLSEQYGGTGQGMAALAVILSGLAKADASFAAVIFIQALAQAAIARWAEQDTRDKYLKQEAGNKPPLFAFPIYQPPSDMPLDVKTFKSNGDYLLEGKFEYLALAPEAKYLLIPAEIEGSGKMSLFIIDKDAKGVAMGEPLISLGLRCCPNADVVLEGVKVGPAEMLGREGQANEEYPDLCARFGGPIAALSMGVLAGAYRAAVTFTKDRYQGGKQVIEHDQVRIMLANMAVLLSAADAACAAACGHADQNADIKAALAAGIFVTDAVTRATTDGVQCLGGYGYMHDYGQEKRMRDAKQIQAMFGPVPLKRLELLKGRLEED